MKNESGLSPWSNMSLGFVPVIITMLLSGFIATDTVVYIGAAIAAVSSLLYYFIHKPRTIHFILFSGTFILIAFSILAFVKGPHNEWPHHLVPLTLEMTIILPLLILHLNKKRYSLASYRNKGPEELEEQIRVTTLTLSCIRIFFALVTIHFALITFGLILTRSVDNGFMRFLMQGGPIVVLIVNVIAGQIEISVLKREKAPEFVPVVTPEGKVIGKVDKCFAEDYKNEYLNPIIRIAIISHNMLFLAKRSSKRVIEQGKIDVPLGTYLRFKEDINCGVKRLLKETFPKDWERLHPEFSIKYKFKNEETDRIVFLFLLDLGTEDQILCDTQFESGKLWTFHQIESNLDQNYFSQVFENEYDHLKLIIETREIYKGF